MERHNETPDPEFDAWQLLSTATAPLLKMFHGKQFSEAVGAAALSAIPAKQDDDGRARTDRGAGDKETTEQQRAYVDQRLRDFAAFERRAAGIEPWRRFRRC
jgi:hypothetical protein